MKGKREERSEERKRNRKRKEKEERKEEEKNDTLMFRVPVSSHKVTSSEPH